MADFAAYLVAHGASLFATAFDDHAAFDSTEQPVSLFGELGANDYAALIIPPANADNLAPTVTLISPSLPLALGAVFLPETLVTLRVDDENEIANCFVWVEYPDGSSEIVYRDGAFRPKFLARSSAVFEDILHRRLTLVLGRGDGVTPGTGWLLTPSIYAAPIDRGGNVT